MNLAALVTNREEAIAFGFGAGFALALIVWSLW
jgi:hypothetical protein